MSDLVNVANSVRPRILIFGFSGKPAGCFLPGTPKPFVAGQARCERRFA
jgi:hypothetical protein